MAEQAGWEYKDFVYPFEKKGVASFRNGSDVESRAWFWTCYQFSILPELQKWLDEGWQPLTEVGLAGFKLRWYKKFVDSRDVVYFMRSNVCEPVEFRVKMRRRKA